MWGCVPPGAWRPGYLAPEPPVRRRCIVGLAWPLGGGPGWERSRLATTAKEVGGAVVVVEFDDSPGFWWDVPSAMVTY